MEISIQSLLEGATRATGTVAIIDVFRAFTTAAVAMANGALRIVMVSTVEEALALRDAGVGQICMGEVRGRAPDEFDFGNSPFEISAVDFGGKTIIQRTSAGTQGIVSASQAKRLYAASLVTADATVRAILSGSPDQITLVAMGDNGVDRTDEDELCALHLRNRLEDRPGDADAVRRLILAGGEVGRFHDPARPFLQHEDVEIALDVDRYDFAVRVEFEDGRPVARIEKWLFTNLAGEGEFLFRDRRQSVPRVTASGVAIYLPRPSDAILRPPWSLPVTRAIWDYRGGPRGWRVFGTG
jgi:2-phosphosulfolactate phosphatase